RRGENEKHFMCCDLGASPQPSPRGEGARSKIDSNYFLTIHDNPKNRGSYSLLKLLTGFETAAFTA
ncbi:MAG TPA: hypothetical protein VKA92_00330, partial [Segetibacter sp.]|nr:hypothetical protein [Segetibacter sp.]